MWNFTLNVIVANIPKEETRIKNYITNAGTTSIRDKYNKTYSLAGVSNDADY